MGRKSKENPRNPRGARARTLISKRLFLWRDNEVYGHGNELRTYCGLEGTILGHVQHGWNPGTGWELLGGDLIRRQSRRIVWGDRQIERSSELGIKVRAAIGAPWLYLEANDLARPITVQAGNKYVFFPMHGTDQHPLDDRPASLLEALEIAEGNPLTVCLFWRDYQDPLNPFRKLSEQLNLSIITAGNPVNKDFLRNLRLILQSHSHFVSNRVTTSTIYALRAGLEIHLTGSSPQISGEYVQDPRVTNLANQIKDAAGNPEANQEIASYELGENHFRDPDELCVILGLTFPSNLAKYPLLAASAFSRIARRVGI